MVKIKQIDEQFYVEDGDKLLPITGKYSVDKKTDMKWFALPENSSNRKLIQEKFLQDGYELTHRETRVIGSTVGKKSLVEYMTAEDAELYKAIIERAQNAREAAKQKAQSPEEKLRAQIERLKAKLATLNGD